MKPPSPNKIFAHNLLISHIGRDSSGVPIFDTAALINTGAYYPLETTLSAAYAALTNTPIEAREFGFYLSQLRAEIGTLISAAEDVAYSHLPASTSRFATQYAAGVVSAPSESRSWLADSPYRLLSFIPPGTLPALTEVIRFIAQEEAGLFYRLLTELSIPSSIIILNEAVFSEKTAQNFTL